MPTRGRPCRSSSSGAGSAGSRFANPQPRARRPSTTSGNPEPAATSPHTDPRVLRVPPPPTAGTRGDTGAGHGDSDLASLRAPPNHRSEPSTSGGFKCAEPSTGREQLHGDEHGKCGRLRERACEVPRLSGLIPRQRWWASSEGRCSGLSRIPLLSDLRALMATASGLRPRASRSRSGPR